MDWQDQRTGAAGVDGGLSPANFTLCSGRGNRAARRNGFAGNLRTCIFSEIVSQVISRGFFFCEAQEARRRCEVYAGLDGFAGQGIFFRAVCAIPGRLSGSQSVAAGVRRGRRGRLRRRCPRCGPVHNFARQDDAGPRTGPRGTAGAGLSSIHYFEGSSVSLRALILWCFFVKSGSRAFKRRDRKKSRRGRKEILSTLAFTSSFPRTTGRERFLVSLWRGHLPARLPYWRAPLRLRGGRGRARSPCWCPAGCRYGQ